MPHQRHELLALHQRPQARRQPLDRKILADIAANDAPRFATLAAPAKSALASAKSAREKAAA